MSLLTALYSYMLAGALARVVGDFVGKFLELVLHDVYGVSRSSNLESSSAVAAIQVRLVTAGLEEWSKEEWARIFLRAWWAHDLAPLAPARLRWRAYEADYRPLRAVLYLCYRDTGARLHSLRRQP